MTQVAVITGTSSGIGLSASVMLARSGFKVVATMRNMKKRALLEDRTAQLGVHVDIRHLDVRDKATVDDCIDSVIETYGRIDLLVNNAGGGFLGTVEQTPLERLQRIMDTNFYGVWRVTQAVLPVMRQAGKGHIITVSSIGGLIGQPFNDAYCASKFAIEGFMESLAPVVKPLGIFVSLVEPGPVNTNFVESARQAGSGMPVILEKEYAPLFKPYFKRVRQEFESVGQTADEVGEIIVQAALASVPHFRYPTSALGHKIISEKYVDPTGDSVISNTSRRLY